MFVAETSAGALYGIFMETVNRFEDNPDLQGHLTTLVDISRSMLQHGARRHAAADTAQLATQLCAMQSSDSIDAVIGEARASLTFVGRLVEADPVLAILARRTLLACIVLQRLSLVQPTFGLQTEELLANVTKEVCRRGARGSLLVGVGRGGGHGVYSG